MKKRGYVFNGIIFLVFVPVVILAIYYSSTVSDIADSDYQELKAMKVYYISANLYEILDQAKEDPLDKNRGNGCPQVENAIEDALRDSIYNGIPIPGPPVGISGDIKCQGAPPRRILYLNITSREDPPSVWVCRGENCVE